jgi:hypothetical protein
MNTIMNNERKTRIRRKGGKKGRKRKQRKKLIWNFAPSVDT